MSTWHLIILLVIILLVFGPGRLEGIGVSLGKAIRGFKKGMEGLDDEKPAEANKPKEPPTSV